MKCQYNVTHMSTTTKMFEVDFRIVKIVPDTPKLAINSEHLPPPPPPPPPSLGHSNTTGAMTEVLQFSPDSSTSSVEENT